MLRSSCLLHCYVCVFAFPIISSLCPAVRAVALQPGDLVITADLGATPAGENYGLMRVDPLTGDRTIISDATHGAGPAMNLELPGIERLAGGQLLVAAGNGIFYVDPTTGDRTLLSNQGAVAAIELGDSIYAASSGKLFRVDPVTGVATTLNGNIYPDVAGMAFVDGSLLVAAAFTGFARYSLGGDFQELYQSGVPGSLIAEGNGRILYGNIGSTLSIPGLYTFDSTLSTSPYDRHLVSGPGIGEPAVGSGSPLRWAAGLGLASNGTIYVANLNISGAGNLLAVDPVTGIRSLLSDATHGSGSTFKNPTGVAVVPEPGSLALALLGLLGFSVMLVRRLLPVAVH